MSDQHLDYFHPHWETFQSSCPCSFLTCEVLPKGSRNYCRAREGCLVRRNACQMVLHATFVKQYVKGICVSFIDIFPFLCVEWLAKLMSAVFWEQSVCLKFCFILEKTAAEAHRMLRQEFGSDGFCHKGTRLVEHQLMPFWTAVNRYKGWKYLHWL